MENKNNYTSEEVGKIVNAYAELVSLHMQIGGGKKIAMPGIEEYKDKIPELVKIIPENVKEKLNRKPSELEKSILATIERSTD